MDSKEILERLLELSRFQITHFADKRYPELVKAQIERGELFEELDKLKDSVEITDALRELRDMVLKSDKELALMFNSEMDSLRTQLKKVTRGGIALKAYSGRISK